MTLQELGQSIREKRTAANISIDEVAGRIKVSGRILKSIEDGSLVGLPHAVYTKSFIRAFGLQVGYNPEELTARLDELFPPESLDETRNEPGPRTRTLPVSSDHGRNIVILLMLLLLLGGLAAGGWYVAKNYGDMILNLVKTPFSAITSPSTSSRQEERPQAVSKFSTPAPKSGGTVSEQTALSPAATSLVARAAGTDPQPHSPGESLQTALQPVSTTPSAPAPAGVGASGSGGAAANSASARADEKNRLQIVAEQPCWISSRVDGVKGREYTMQPKDSLVFTYANSLEVTFGNAGGVTMVHNGRDVGKPGRLGQRATITFPRQGE